MCCSPDLHLSSMLSCHSRCACSISDVYLMFPGKVVVCFYTPSVPLPLFLFSTDFEEKGSASDDPN